MSDNLQPPLTPPDCDLRDFGYMPLEIERLRHSSAWRRAKRKPALAFYMVNLWAGAFHEVPAGSIPDDDEAQADLAHCELRRWQRFKPDVLTGWVKCSDGRLYHKVVAEKALEGWIEKLGRKKSSGIGNAKRWECTFDSANLDQKIIKARALLHEMNPGSRILSKKTVLILGLKNPDLSQGTGTGTGTGNIPLLRNGQAPPAAPENKNPPKVEKADDPWKAVYDRGKKILGQNAGGTITLLRHFFNQKPYKVLAKLEDAAEQRDSVTYINAFLWANVERLPPGSHVGPVARMP